LTAGDTLNQAILVFEIVQSLFLLFAGVPKTT